MTLVIATAKARGLTLKSDTEVTDPSAAGTNAIPGNMKIIVLSKSIAVAYAGPVGAALDAIRRCHSKVASGDDGETIEAELISTSLRTGADFILARLVSTQKLTKISSGNAYAGGSQYWIGDAVGISTLQQTVESLRDSPWTSVDEDAASVMEVVFTNMVLQRQCPGIGGVEITVYSCSEGMRYVGYAGSMLGAPITLTSTHVIRPPEQWQTTYRYRFFCPLAAGEAGGALFLEDGKVGFLYLPLQRDKPIQIVASTGEELIEQVRSRFGVALQRI